MKITVERIKQIIKEEYQKVHEHDEYDFEGDEGPIIHAQGLGTYGDDPQWVLKSALRDLEEIAEGMQEAADIVQEMIEGEVDAEEVERVISRLGSPTIDNAKAKLQGALDQRLEINEAINEKKRT